jgi:hypothetical protein
LALLYGSETLTVRRTDWKTIGRSIGDAAGYTVLDKERRGEMRSQLEMRELAKQIQEKKKNWLQHLQRMLSEIAPNNLYIINR